MTTLYLWTVVAASYAYAYRDWRPMGSFATLGACHAAAKELKAETYKCLFHFDGKQQ